MITILYLSGIKSTLLKQSITVLEDVASGRHTNGMNVEKLSKLKGYNIYSVRFNDRWRILFSYFSYEGKQAIL